MRTLLAGRDTCVVMPTGGGKSCLYQLPAVISATTVVVSADRTDQDHGPRNRAMNPAVMLFLNNDQQAKVIRGRDGAYRLVYRSPSAWPASCSVGSQCHRVFAIDEAHHRVGTNCPVR